MEGTTPSFRNIASQRGYETDDQHYPLCIYVLSSGRESCLTPRIWLRLNYTVLKCFLMSFISEALWAHNKYSYAAMM